MSPDRGRPPNPTTTTTSSAASSLFWLVALTTSLLCPNSAAALQLSTARTAGAPDNVLAVFPEPAQPEDGSLALQILEQQAVKMEGHKVLIKVAGDAARTLGRVTTIRGKLDALKQRAEALHNENLDLARAAAAEADAAEAAAAKVEGMQFAEAVNRGAERAVEEVGL